MAKKTTPPETVAAEQAKNDSVESLEEELARKEKQAVIDGYRMKVTSKLRAAADGREGIDTIIDVLDEVGFYTAPASGGNHKHSEHGLVEHSLNVLEAARKISDALIGKDSITDEFRNSVTICALLHDLGKCGDFDKPMYVPNILKSGNVSTAKPFTRNKQLTNVPHGVRSAMMVERWMGLTEAEEYAIMYHDGMYEPSNVAVIRGHETTLQMIIHWADFWASHVVEGGSGEDDD